MSIKFMVQDGQRRATSTQLGTVALTNANFDGTHTAAQAIVTAMNALMSSPILRYNLISPHDYPAAVPSTDQDVMRGRKWAVTYVDSVTGALDTFFIPCAILETGGGTPLADSQGEAILTHALWTALDNALQDSHIASPAGHSISIRRARLMTRG